MDEVELTDSRPCPMCNMSDNEDAMILCDGCDLGVHSYCLDLDHEANTNGAWYCADCHTEGTGRAGRRPGVMSRIYGIRNRDQQHASRFRTQASSASDWARVWRSVWNQLDLDLDFPYEDDAASAHYRRSYNAQHRNGRRFREWERRLEVAQEQGAGETFEDTADILARTPLISRPRPEPPEPESAEELLAWNALEKARDIEADPTPRPRKRKPTPTSPADGLRRKRRRTASASPDRILQAPEAERKFKRPQTRRNPDNHTVAESSTARALEGPSEVPSFLQSLLNEVEASTPEESGSNRLTLNLSNLPSHCVSDHPSPQHTSPAASPTVSNYPSPRALSATPPPFGGVRPGSPILLTSNIEPIYPPAPDFSKDTISKTRKSKSQTRVGRWTVDTARSSSPSRARSEDASPGRNSMSLGTKEKLQRLVKNALKGPYHSNQINKEQYADINRAVSHILYDKVGDEGELNDENEETLTSTAKEEVAKALEALREPAS